MSLPSRHTSTTLSVRPSRTPARSPARGSAHHQRAYGSCSGIRPRYKTNKDEKIPVALTWCGGTFDVSSRSSFGDGVPALPLPQVTASAGRWRRLTCRVIDWLADKFAKDHGGIDLRKDDGLQRLKAFAEKAKRWSASSSTTQAINLLSITADATGPKHLDHTLTRAEFEIHHQGPSDRCQACTGSSAARCRVMNQGDIDEVILVGGHSVCPPCRSW